MAMSPIRNCDSHFEFIVITRACCIIISIAQTHNEPVLQCPDTKTGLMNCSPLVDKCWDLDQQRGQSES